MLRMAAGVRAIHAHVIVMHAMKESKSTSNASQDPVSLPAEKETHHAASVIKRVPETSKENAMRNVHAIINDGDTVTSTSTSRRFTMRI